MGGRPEIVVVGSHAPGLFVRVKRVPIAGETVIGWDFCEPMDGGKGSNQAIAASRLGAAVSFIGCVGDDRLGHTGELWMREAGVDTRHIIWSSGIPTGVGFTLLDEGAQPAMVVSRGANSELSKEQVEYALDDLRGARVLLTQFEILPDVAIHATKTAKRHGMISVVNPAPAPDSTCLNWSDVDILVPNEIEAKHLVGHSITGKADPLALAELLRTRTGVACVMITLGEEGIAACDETGIWQIKPPLVQMVDTSGAGDVFCAALAVALAQGISTRAAAEWSCYAAALSVTRAGTIPSFPTRREVDEFRRIKGKGSPSLL
jgi:ribokinase